MGIVYISIIYYVIWVGNDGVAGPEGDVAVVIMGRVMACGLSW